MLFLVTKNSRRYFRGIFFSLSPRISFLFIILNHFSKFQVILLLLQGEITQRFQSLVRLQKFKVEQRLNNAINHFELKLILDNKIHLINRSSLQQKGINNWNYTFPLFVVARKVFWIHSPQKYHQGIIIYQKIDEK